LVFSLKSKMTRLFGSDLNIISLPLTVNSFHFHSTCKVELNFYIAIGGILLGSGLTLLLLPFSLAQNQTNAFKSPAIIAMLVVSITLLALFALFEHFIAPTPYIPFSLLRDPTIFGAFVLLAVVYISYFSWDGYYTSYLQVVFNLSISDAGYIGSIYSIGTVFWGIIVGVLIRSSGRFKWLACVALVCETIGGALIIVYRQPDTTMAAIVIPQIIIAFSGGTLYICGEMAGMAVASHSDVADILAVFSLAVLLGGAIGSAISGGIWTNTIPAQLLMLLPDDTRDQALRIYGNLDTQLSFPMGDPTRSAIIEAYGIAQRNMCIAGTAVLALGFVAVAMWRDIKVKDIRQVEGTVF
jgi:hypothetical protein